MEFLAHGNADRAWRDQSADHSSCERHGPRRCSAQCVATDQALLESWLRRLSVMNAP